MKNNASTDAAKTDLVIVEYIKYPLGIVIKNSQCVLFLVFSILQNANCYKP